MTAAPPLTIGLLYNGENLKLIERCIEALDHQPDAILAHSYMGTVDGHGDVVALYDYRLNTDSPRASERFRSLMFTDGGDDFYGVIRTEIIRQIAPHDSFHNAGRKFVAELSLMVRSTKCPKSCSSEGVSGRGDNLGSIQRVCCNLDPRRKGQSQARLIAVMVAAYPVAINRAPLSSVERRRCYQVYLSWIAARTVLQYIPPGRRTQAS